ncbi:MAG: DUF6439 family protein [Microcoleaceae cyanobacterium MO_207.B10]|nr:DUF6439 family protein [Microcoleaceae cyanobacterium MO_207.B10]
MLKSNSTPATISTKLDSPKVRDLQEYSTLELAQALAERLAIPDQDWHRLKSNRQVRALELTAAALVFLVKGQPTEAIARLHQATSWLDRSISAPPCPSHGSQNNK